MPSSPAMCIGKNVTLKNTNSDQKFQAASRWLGRRPVIFGSQ
jgi:hypothetical protein